MMKTPVAFALLVLAACVSPRLEEAMPVTAEQWASQPATNVDEAKVGAYVLPDLLTMSNGGRVKSVADWEMKRRPEIMKLLEQYQEGVTPAGKTASTVEVVEAAGVGMGGLARRKQVRIRFAGHDDVAIRVLLYTPAKATGAVPTLLHISFSPNVLLFDEPGIDEGMAWTSATKGRVPDRQAVKVGGFDAKSFVARGYGVAVVYCGDIYPDFEHGNSHGVPTLFGPAPTRRAPDEWGAIGAWAWGLSRVADYLTVEPLVDGKKLALSGVSRLGKAVLWAGAQDKRFAVVIPMLSGEGGAAISRRFYGETVADLTKPARFPYWFAPRYQTYAFRVDELPVDGHMLLAMIAPRPVLQIVGTKDTWSDPMGEYVAAKAALPVWGLYGKGNAGLAQYPAPDQPALGDTGFLLHEGEHTTLPIDFLTMADFLDRQFGRPN